MRSRFYPAVLERDPSGVFGVWFPDFPGAVAGGRSQEEAVARAQEALERAMQEQAERELPLPEPTAFDAIRTPKEAAVVAFVALAAAPPDPSERVNIYLPRSVLARADELAGAWGMSRSSLFGLALTHLMAGQAFGAPPTLPTKKGRRR
ncbi:MAG TPA: type II toxin-antitoxin system HicB family antitoxin [Caulobacteraceae bacterium]|jgi:predicted RNase H-like HicB family nuclease|nr:type II toxin-antitoxin system HicB family antitoxin [Caulobacteraceae bacterium]